MTMTTSRVLLLAIILLLTSEAGVFAQQKGATIREISPSLEAQTNQAAEDNAKEAGRADARQPESRYRLRSGDSLEVSFPLTPEFNQLVIVQPDGYINLRGGEDVKAEGLTTPELKQKLQEAYAEVLHEPVLTVELKDFVKPYFIAFGEVMKPGKYDLRGDTTVTQAVAIAGGFNDSAKHSQVLLFRRVSDEWFEVKELNVKRMLYEKGMNQDVSLRPGDMLLVPKSFFSKVKGLINRAGIGVLLRPTLF